MKSAVFTHASLLIPSPPKIYANTNLPYSLLVALDSKKNINRDRIKLYEGKLKEPGTCGGEGGWERGHMMAVFKYLKTAINNMEKNCSPLPGRMGYETMGLEL